MSGSSTNPQTGIVPAQHDVRTDDAHPGDETPRELPFDPTEFGTGGFFPRPDSVAGPDVT